MDFLGFTEPHPKAWRVDGVKVRFPKLGSLGAVLHRPLEERPKTCTLRREGDQWFVSILCEIDIVDPLPRTEPVVGLDRGVIALVADSDGNIVENPSYLEASLRKLARAQRIQSRRKKGSRNRQKQRARVARIHRQIRRQRQHMLHQLSARLSKSHASVVVEKLQIGNMLKANTGLARRVSDAGWGLLAQMLRYKLAWSGGKLVEVPAAYSSQTCSSCGEVDAASRKGPRFLCTHCGHDDHADINAARVLKSRANRSVLPVEGSLLEGSRRSRKVVALRVPRRPPQSSAL